MAVLTSILVINSGSSSLKVTLFAVQHRRAMRLIDFHGKAKGALTELAYRGKKEMLRMPFSTSTCLTVIWKILCKQFAPPALIAHRFVHGGKKNRSTAVLNPTIRRQLKAAVPLAPVHNQSCYEGMEWAYQVFKNQIPQIVVFDTAFFNHLPKVAAIYAIPRELSKTYQILRYGFHGISHQYLWQRYAKNHTRDRKVITLHLGHGCSMSAIDNGHPLDTSMGFSPLEGLIMGSRSGDVDPSIINYICQQAEMTPQQVTDLLNFQSGLLGLSGKTSDMSKLWQLRPKNRDARLAIELFCYRICKYIGAYLAVLKQVDALIFSGGIGENSPGIRKRILKEMAWLGVAVDDEANRKAIKLSFGEMRIISKPQSTPEVYVIATDENQAIADEVLSLMVSKKRT